MDIMNICGDRSESDPLIPEFDFEYGENNRLAEVKQSVATVAAYTYNGKGERTKKESTETIHYFYNQSGQLIAELDGTGTTVREYIYLGGEPLAQVYSGNIYYYHTDHLGTPEKLTDQNQQTVWAADYDPFGKATITTETITNNLRLPGQYWDVETGLHYNEQRYYSSEVGRYWTSDPIGLWGGLNTYLYVYGNPINLIDPYGLWALGDPLPEGLVNYSAGLGDALLFGFGGDLRELAGVDGGVDECAAEYEAGILTSFAFGGARLAYAGLAKTGSLLASSARSASNFRNTLKGTFRGGLFPNARRKTYEQLRRAGKSDAEIRSSSGRTNSYVNAVGAQAAAGAAVATATGECECNQ